MIEPVEELIAHLKKLPGIGRKSAERIAFHLLNAPDEQAGALAESIRTLTSSVRRCQRCHNLSVEELCTFCRNPQRDASMLCVVAQPWEILKIERTGSYHGLYHVLGGLISPLDEIQASDLTIESLVERVRTEGIQEVILALEPRLDGEITAMHIVSQLKPSGVRLTKIAQGVPVGRDLEFADDVTLGRALQSRTAL
jgi:recombination protein RecR